MERSCERPDWRRAILLPYAACIAIAIALLPFDGSVQWTTVGLSLALQLGIGLLVAFGPRLGLNHLTSGGSLAITVYLFAVVLLRDGAGTTAGFGPLVLLPVIWASLRGRRDELAVAVIGVALVYIGPAMLIGGTRYPSGSWRAGVLFAVISATVGVTVIQLVRQVQAQLGDLSAQAGTDELTGLPNRRAWRSFLARELGRAGTTGRPITVALVDIDHFKAYNDTHGHLAGDRMLLAATSAWHAVLRDWDVLARWGGDEFGLLLPSCTARDALTVLGRLREAHPDLPFSAGVVQWQPGTSPEDLLSAADDALYEAKGGARNTNSVATLEPSQP